jgi:hypothetical protein
MIYRQDLHRAAALAVFVLLAAGQSAHAQDQKPKKQDAPKLRVAFGGMHLDNGEDFERIVQAAEIQYEKVRPLDLGGWHGWWLQEGAKGLSRSDIQSKPEFKSLADGKVDVFVLSTLKSMPPSREGAGKNTAEFLAALVDVGIKNNPNFRVVWRLWLHADGKKQKDSFSLEGTRKRADPNNSKIIEEIVGEINKKHGKQVVLIVPAVYAEINLVNMVAEGKFPGVEDVRELWIEYNMHGGRFLKALAAYCNFAVIYEVSPEGLQPSFKGRYFSTKGSSVRHSLEDISAEQHAILQKIAWETVSKYSQPVISK